MAADNSFTNSSKCTARVWSCSLLNFDNVPEINILARIQERQTNLMPNGNPICDYKEKTLV